MIRTQVSMTDEQQDALRRMAASRRISQSAVLREALDNILELERRSRHIERARSACGSFRSGHGSLSTDHDEALDDAFSA